MIFHTAANKSYHDAFFEQFISSVKENYTNAKFSFHSIGHLEKKLGVDYFSFDTNTLDDIKQKYNTNDNRHASGYYCISRWLSIPVVGEHVCVCDIDIKAANKIDHDLIENYLEVHKVINVTRHKPKDNTEGGMMVIFLHKDICQSVKQFATELLDKEQLTWALDVRVRNHLYNLFNVKNILKMQDISKFSSSKIEDPWFLFSKVNKFENLSSIQI